MNNSEEDRKAIERISNDLNILKEVRDEYHQMKKLSDMGLCETIHIKHPNRYDIVRLMATYTINYKGIIL